MCPACLTTAAVTAASATAGGSLAMAAVIKALRFLGRRRQPHTEGS